MALSDILKKYGDGPAVEGIMMPTISTTQEIYNAATDGIMTVQGNQYTGPNAVVQYGNEQQGFPRQLKEIEGPMLPQFDQTTLPKVGEGIMEASAATSTPKPISTDPVVEQPTVDPCPPGYQLVNGTCQPIQQRDDNKENSKNKSLSERGYVKVLDKFTGSPQAGAMNSIKMQQLENKYGANAASLIGTTSQQSGFDGAHIRELPQTEIDRLNNLGINKGLIEGPPGKPEYKNGVLINKETGTGVYKVIGNTTSVGEFIKEFKLPSIPEIIKSVINSINKKEEATEIISKKISPTLQAQYESSVVETKDIPTETKMDFGELSKNFGKLQSSLLDTTNQLASIQENMLNMMKGRGTDTVALAELQKIEKKLKAKKDKEIKKAEILFKQSVKATKDQPLTDNEKKYLDSSNRKALAGESKDKNGNVDNRSGKVSGRENSGFGFKATSANYNKKTNTFDQRFK